MAELKKCPFCGEKLKYNMRGCHEHKRNGCILGGFEFTKAHVEAWNNRVNEFDAEKYEKLILADMERKHTENQELLSELKAVLPTTTEAEIRAKAIDEFAEKLRKNFRDIGAFTGYEVKMWINEVAEQLKGE